MSSDVKYKRENTNIGFRADDLLEQINFSWDTVSAFLTCAQAGSVRKAAYLLNVDPTTISRKLTQLERALDLSLFTRHSNGLTLTAQGRVILEHARKMQKTTVAMRRYAAGQKTEASGVVRISTTDGNGTYWIMPRLVEFQKTYPKVTVSLSCDMDSQDPMDRLTDISLHYAEPDHPDLIKEQLGWLHLHPYASREYLTHHGVPKSIADIGKHRIVQQVFEKATDETYARALGLSNVEGIVGIRTNSSTATLYAIEQGVGIGALPNYTSSMTDKIVPIDAGLIITHPLWLSYRPDIADSKHHQIVIDWLRRIYDPARYQCFQQAPIDPLKLVELLGASSQAS